MTKKTARKPISQTLRFEVFKRDGFVCQYCGAHPPEVLLHVDHIIAVAKGGDNDFDNLITSCVPCNQGKGVRSLSIVPQSMAERMWQVSEKERQIAGYSEIMEARRTRIERDCWRVAEALEPGAIEDGFNRSDFASIKKFVERLGVHDVLDAADLASSRKPHHMGGRWGRWRYFCGVCWSKIRDLA